MSDLQLRQNVLDELEFEPSVNAAHVGVTVDNGVVTVSGHVGSYAEKLAAVAAARRVSGVKGLADEIQVRSTAGKKTSDEEIAQRAIGMLEWDTVVPRDSVQVMVQDGMVTLTGAVDWFFQRYAAEEDVRKLSGVNGVVNKIDIKPDAKAEDIKRKIEGAFKRHAELEAKGIRVTVRENDKVVLEGEVDNWYDRSAAEAAAWSAPGVKSVEVRLIIK